MDPHNIQVGDTFVLCDAGGGTVDLVSYKVSALKPFLQIAEAAPGSGASCGATFLNRIFQKFLKDKLGNDPNWDEDELEEVRYMSHLVWDDSLIITGNEAFRSDCTQFFISVSSIDLTKLRQVKRSFTDSPGEEYQIPGKFTAAFELDSEEKLIYSAVPGLSDSVTRSVRRGRFRLTGSDVRSIFDVGDVEVIFPSDYLVY